MSEEIKNINEEEVQEYVTFTTTTKDGQEIEMAVVDEFEFERKNYLVSALVENDQVLDDNRFIYRMVLTADGGFNAEKITNPKDYERIAKVYMEDILGEQ